jgi:hypothetical protein
VKVVKIEHMVQRSDPIPMYVTGFTLKRMAENLHWRLKRTTEGHPIVSNELYCVTERGVFLVE